MAQYDRTVTSDEIQALFLSSNPNLTAQKQAYDSAFITLKKELNLVKILHKSIIQTISTSCG